MPRERGDGAEIEASTKEVCHEDDPGAGRESLLQELALWFEGRGLKVHRNRAQPMRLDEAYHVGVGDRGDEHLVSGSCRERPEQEVEPGAHGETGQNIFARRKGPNDLRVEPPASEGPEAGREPEEQIADGGVEPVAGVQEQAPEL